ncbi:glycosyltransferase family 39 protein [Lentzea sp. NPDC003310]|uniref:glycosyltransferase family 39 protein n=1 Tax=Lentzea sp. NPDC003310 TaxID=3154447 RepID=UPI0033A6259F
MTVRADVAAAPVRAEVRVPIAWRPVGIVVAVVSAVQAVFLGAYGLSADELYFRMLGDRPGWGYTDQPAALPLLAKAASVVFGDSAWGIRVPALLCGAAVLLLLAAIVAELGGGRRAQLLALIAVASSPFGWGVGHFLLTTSVDMVVWCAVVLFTLRALLRGDGRWWIHAGITCGIGLYVKYMILLLPVVWLISIAVLGPRSAFRDRRLYLGMSLGLLIGLPSLLYQVTHGWPQFEMAEALGREEGAENRSLFLTNMIIMLGPVIVPVWISGIVGLLRWKSWHPVRSLAPAFLVALALVLLVQGGRADYTAGFQLALVGAGAVVADRWMTRARWRPALLFGLVGLFALPQFVLAMPVLPEKVFARYPVASLSVETIGWPAMAEQVGRVYKGLPAAERERAVVLTENFGEAGALHLHRERVGLPAVYSGHNELHNWGPPPESADVVIAVGLSRDTFAGWRQCDVAARYDNGIGLEASKEQGREILVCRGPSRSWQQWWPSLRRLGGY